MRDNIKIVGVLTIVCLVCALFLSLAESMAREKINYNESKAVKKAIFDIVDECKDVKEVSIKGTKIYKLFDGKNSLIGYGFLATGEGYQGKIKIMAVTDKDFNKLLGIEIISSQETPGLGAKINEGFFKNQFRSLNIKVPIEYTKSEVKKDNQIKAITGATISSKSVVNILNKAIDELKPLLIK